MEGLKLIAKGGRMKTVLIENLNNKLECDVFIHLASEPGRMILGSELPLQVMVDDGKGKKFEAELVDLLRIDNLLFIARVLTYASHGMDRDGYLQMKKKAEGDNWMNNQVAAYVYRKVK